MNTTSLLTIDGSHGEGGGQILRTSLALAILTETPVRIERIRAGRKRPGLKRQHRTAVLAAAEISGGEVVGADLDSQEIEFRPGRVDGGEFAFRIGTAGSTTLVAQTVLLPLLFARERSRVRIEGGTHNIGAPSFDFLSRSFLPALRKLGAEVRIELERPGFVPAGGGRIVIEIEPIRQLEPAAFTERGEVRRRRAVAMVSNLSRKIADRELDVVRRKLGWSERESEFTAVEVTDSPGPGNVLWTEVETDSGNAIFTGFGERGIRSETVASQVAASTREFLRSTSAVEEHLADQLVLPLALAGGGALRTTRRTLHTKTNLEVIEKFLPIAHEHERLDRLDELITIRTNETSLS